MSEQANAFILHARPYRETSYLVDVLTDVGERFRLLSRGGRKRFSELLLPFAPLYINWNPGESLGSLRTVEAAGAAIHLQGDTLPCGLYINELMLRMLAEHDPYPELYTLYSSTLNALALSQEIADIEALLRVFEWQLLDSLGYGLNLDASTIAADRHYRISRDYGLIEVAPTDIDHISGHSLLALLTGVDALRSTSDARRQTKQLMRRLLSPHLGQKPLSSRALFGASNP